MSKPPPLPSSCENTAHWYSGKRLWRTLLKVAGAASHKTVFSALTLFYCLKDKDTPAWAKGIIVGALGYLIFPADLIPDIMPGVGFTDDWGAIVAALGTVAAYIKNEHKSQAKAQTERIFGTKKPSPSTEFLDKTI